MGNGKDSSHFVHRLIWCWWVSNAKRIWGSYGRKSTSSRNKYFAFDGICWNTGHKLWSTKLSPSAGTEAFVSYIVSRRVHHICLGETRHLSSSHRTGFPTTAFFLPANDLPANNVPPQRLQRR